MRTQVQLTLVVLTLLATTVATVDDQGRPSLLPQPARAAEAKLAASVSLPSSEAPRAGSAADNMVEQRGVSSAARYEMGVSSRRLVGGWGMVYLPKGLTMDAEGHYDLVLHFHGGAPLLEPQLDEVGLNAVLVTVNLGIGSGAYRNHFADPGRFEQMLASIDETVAELGPSGSAKLRRLALSNWSAGYGALAVILSSAENRERVDAVLMADGMHSTLIDKRQRRFYDPAMEPYLAYGKLAIDGDKLMLVSHSDIATRDYASTTETARYLEKALELEEAEVDHAPESMTAHDRFTRGNLQITGYLGQDAKAHCHHLWSFGEMFLAPLKARWDADAA